MSILIMPVNGIFDVFDMLSIYINLQTNCFK
ncbi:hypothetical protein [Escherichia coli]